MLFVNVDFVPSPLFGSFSVFTSNPWFISRFLWYLCQIISLLTSPCGIECKVPNMGRVGWWSGVAWVIWRRSWPCTNIYASTQFNVPTQGPMLGPSPDPCPAGYWLVEICGSYASKISQPRLWFDFLSSPAHVKWVCPFLLPWFDSIVWIQPRLPSLACHRQKEQTKKNVSFERGSAWYAYPSWYFPSKTGALTLYHICRNMRQRLQFWSQWCPQPIDPINLGSWRQT